MRKRKPNIITDKAKLYLDKYPDVNEAFNNAKSEDRDTLKSIYKQGVDINYDLNVPYNMFNWSIIGNEVCSPYFLETMFKYGRKDIAIYAQKVFESACTSADSRHIAIFMKHKDTYKIDIFRGMRSALSSGNKDNLHHLMLYKRPSKEEISELWDSACRVPSRAYMLLYMSEWFGCTITKEKLIENMPYIFFDVLAVLIKIYLVNNGEPFEIKKDIVDKIIKFTDDRINKLELLDVYGFKVENFEEIKNTSKNLPEPILSRCSVSF
jgi:hypothetical protein